ncbi:hypothetical protein FACS1894217_12100 [Clostridia bacterium]|nr:hypothetical protein FACS1894217_12100 [Clostridia bacterium]
MNKLYSVFISSTFEDLREERQRVSEVLLNNNCIPVGMELFSASHRSPWEVIQKCIDECDFYILIIAGKYGTIDDETKISYTQREFDYALTIGKDILLFLHEDITQLKDAKTESTAIARKRLNSFRKKAESGRTRVTYSSPDDLGIKVTFAANEWIKGKIQNDTIENYGWIRAANEVIPSFSTYKEVVPHLSKLINKLLCKDVSDPQVSNALSQLAYNISNSLVNNISYDGMFYSSFNRTTTILLKDDCITITTDTNIEIVNPLLTQHIYRSDPMFRKKNEFNSYTVTKLLVNAVEIDSGNSEVFQFAEIPKVAKENDNYCSGKKILVDVSSFVRSRINLVSEYDTDYTNFFQVYVAKLPCERFSFTARLKDERTTKTPRHIVKWAFFGDDREQYHLARERMKQDGDFVQVTRPIEWVFPGSGYICTLNQIQ